MGDTDLVVYFGLFVIQRKTHVSQLIVLVRKQPCGTYNPNSGLTVVAHWPVDSPDQPCHNPKAEAAKGANSRSPQTGHSTLGQ